MADGHAALWLTVVAFGVYHGLNPAMGWPLAVANGLSARRDAAVFSTMAPLATGHFLAMAVAVLPFALLSEYVQRGQAIGSPKALALHELTSITLSGWPL